MEKRVGVISCHKNVTDTWPETELAETQCPCPGGGTHAMRLAVRETQVTARDAPPLPVLEVRRLAQSGHQTAIITTARTLAIPAIAGRMFSRWCQETNPAHDRAIDLLLGDLTRAGFRHPETGHRFICQLV